MFGRFFVVMTYLRHSFCWLQLQSDSWFVVFQFLLHDFARICTLQTAQLKPSKINKQAVCHPPTMANSISSSVYNLYNLEYMLKLQISMLVHSKSKGDRIWEFIWCCMHVYLKYMLQGTYLQNCKLILIYVLLYYLPILIFVSMNLSNQIVHTHTHIYILSENYVHLFS